MTNHTIDRPAAPYQEYPTDRPLRYRILTKRGWEIYIPAKDTPVSFAVQHGREICLVYRDVSNEAYFAARPDAQVRILFRTGPAVDHFGSGYFTWRTVTRGGGVMRGDVYDIFHLVRRFERGSPMSKLTRAMRHIAAHDLCLIVKDSPDLMSAWGDDA